MGRKWILFTLGGLLIGAAASLFLLLFERYTEELDLGWGPQARRNPFLAAEQFLAATGLQSRHADNIAVLDQLADTDTLFVASSSQIYNPRRAEELLQWVEAGGHAIVVAHGNLEARHWLLEPLQVTLEEGREAFEFEHPFRELLGQDSKNLTGKSPSEMLREHNRKLREGSADEATPGETTPSETAQDTQKPEPPRNPQVPPQDLITLTDSDGDEYQLHFDASRLLHHPALDSETTDSNATGVPVFWARIRREDTSVPFMQFERGEGRITLLADGGLWRNDRIGHFDHAWFLRQLASDGDFVFLTRPHFASLAELARRYAAEFFLAGVLALLAWLWRRTRRFGPLAPDAETGRRSLLEHIRACGHYYWRAQKCENLLLSQRRSLLRRLGASNADAATRRRLCTRLSTQLSTSAGADSGLNESDIAACLWGDPPHSEEAFTQRMRNLQQIEAAL